MSVEIDWQKLVSDGDEIAESIRSFLDNHLKQVSLPSIIESISVTSFDLGSKAPNIVIKQISDPLPEFYSASDPFSNIDPPQSSANLQNLLNQIHKGKDTSKDEHSGQPLRTPRSVFQTKNGPGGTTSPFAPRGMPPMSPSSIFSSMSGLANASNGSHATGADDPKPEHAYTPNGTNSPLPSPGNPKTKPAAEDVQLLMEVSYDGDINMGLSTTLLVNYPSPNFGSLPLNLQVTGIKIKALVVVAYIKNAVHVSFLCDLDENDDVIVNSRIDIVQNVKIESEIGYQDDGGSVLRNVGKVERFLLEQVRQLARNEVAWPGWVTLEF